nr:retrovirus-related Pol polyprotein from transposon TNT 1-94 [Tanacetum cinerariifolium]
GDEHLDTIHEKESDKFIKSSVEDLVPNPSFNQTQPPQSPVIYPPPQETSSEIWHDQEKVINDVYTFLRKFNCYSFFETPKVLLLAWDRVFKIKDAFGNEQYKPKDVQELFHKLLNDVQNIHEELAEYINTPGWNCPAFYNNGDDDDVDYTIAITPVLSAEEPDNSLSIGDEHLDTIPATESNEVIKSSVEDLIPIPSESEGIPDTMCDVHLVNNPTLLEAKDHFEIVIIPLVIMTLSTMRTSNIQCAGSDTRPPMLDRTDFASWKQRIRLYCRGKDNGVNILKSIDEGPYILGTFRETLAESTEGTPQFGPERPRVYSDLNSNEQDRYNADIRGTNILLQGLPKDIYTLINHYTDAKDIWDNVKMLLEGSELTKEDRESQLYDDFEHFRQHKEESINDYYVRFSKLINDIRNIKMTMPKLQLNSK